MAPSRGRQAIAFALAPARTRIGRDQANHVNHANHVGSPPPRPTYLIQRASVLPLDPWGPLTIPSNAARARVAHKRRFSVKRHELWREAQHECQPP